MSGELSARKVKRRYRPPAERGLGAAGGGWNVSQASAWSGIGSAALRKMAERREIPCYHIGRRILIPRQGFIDWFNQRSPALDRPLSEQTHQE
jgi:hypothetical protein